MKDSLSEADELNLCWNNAYDVFDDRSLSPYQGFLIEKREEAFVNNYKRKGLNYSSPTG